jgi:signal transduction histidine kinase/ActR/RegA family two-component response regulator
MTARPVLRWISLPHAARLYVAAVIGIGACAFVAFFPPSIPRPLLFITLLAASCATSIWKVNLPIALTSGSTLSVSYAADLTALLLLGPRQATIIAVAGVLTQCTVRVKERYPLYRTAFSMAAEAITIAASGSVYAALGGTTGSIAVLTLARPLLGAIVTYFVLNTGLVAGAIALSTNRSVWRVWHDDFLWSGTSFIVAGTAGAIAAVVIDRGEQWLAVLMLAPVYMTFRSYQVFISRLELLERERAARASAEQANRLKDQFLAVVSHELRTPLNAILGWAELLQSGKLDEAKGDRASRAILESAKRQAQLIDELLDVARIMSGKLRLDRSTVDLVEIANSAVAVVQPVIEAKHIRVEIESSPGLSTVFGDSSRLQQVIWNLLSNAVKFTPEGGTVRVRLHTAAGRAEMVVADSGDGIPHEFLPHVFEPFRQADASSTRTHSGLGLGLSIVKQIVEAHGGTVTAENNPTGRGAVFTVRLPIVAVRHHRRATDVAVQQTVKDDNSLRGLTVMVVDDDDESRHVVAAHLESCDASVLTAGSAAEALDLLQQHSVHVLLADIAMPGEDGYSLIRKLRALNASVSSVPAAALTAFAREEDRQDALDAGFQLHLSKPIDAGSLIAAVATLARWNAPQQRRFVGA